MTLFKHSYIIIAVFTTLVPLHGSAAESRHSSPSIRQHTMELILDRWRARSERVSRFHFKWTASEWEAAGWRSGPPVLPGEERVGGKSPLPSEDIEFDVTVDLIVDGNNGRHLRSGKEWVPSARDFFARDHLEQWTADRVSVFFGEVLNVVEASAMITSDEETVRAVPTSSIIRPVMFALRQPLVDEWNWRLRDETATMNGRECLIIEHRKESYSREPTEGEQLTRAWIDPALDYSVLRLSTHTGKQLLSELTIHEYQVEQDIPIPVSWTRKRFHRQGDRQLYNQVECRVRFYSINDDVPAIPDFKSWLPAGTDVTVRGAGSNQAVKQGTSNGGVLMMLGVPILLLFAFRIASLCWRKRFVTTYSSQENLR